MIEAILIKCTNNHHAADVLFDADKLPSTLAITCALAALAARNFKPVCKECGARWAPEKTQVKTSQFFTLADLPPDMLPPEMDRSKLAGVLVTREAGGACGFAGFEILTSEGITRPKHN